MELHERAQVLNKKQKRQAVNAGKKAYEKSLKNVIALPYDKYWPLVNDKEGKNLTEILQKCLQNLKLSSESLPISELQGTSNAEKKKMKLSFKQKKENTAEYKEACRLRGMLFLGVNAVSRSLETNSAAAVMISGDADPQLMVQHVVQLAGMKQVPIIVLNTLRNICTEAMGFGCVALAFKKCVIEDGNEFCEIYKEIKSVSIQFPVPESLVILSNVSRSNEHSSERVETVKNIKTETSTPNYHLKRPLGKKRAFIPGSECDDKKSSTDFISLGNMDENEEMQSLDSEIKPIREIKPKKSYYQPLVVKKVKPNPDKIKKTKKKCKNKN